MRERQLLRSVVALNDIREEPIETLTPCTSVCTRALMRFINRFEKARFVVLYKSVDLHNTTSKMLRNIYHVKDINTLKELVKRANRYLDMEREHMVTNLPAPA